MRSNTLEWAFLFFFPFPQPSFVVFSALHSFMTLKCLYLFSSIPNSFIFSHDFINLFRFWCVFFAQAIVKLHKYPSIRKGGPRAIKIYLILFCLLSLSHPLCIHLSRVTCRKCWRGKFLSEKLFFSPFLVNYVCNF